MAFTDGGAYQRTKGTHPPLSAVILCEETTDVWGRRLEYIDAEAAVAVHLGDQGSYQPG